MRTCHSTICGKPTTGYSRFCSTHKNHRRRHGHEHQAAIRVHDLKSYIARVRRRMKKNADSPIWSILEARWADLMDECRALCTETVFVRWERTAADELLKVGANVPVRTITETVAAVVALQEDEPRQFKSDDAFRVQLARRVRGLTDTNCGSTYDHRRRKVRRVYRDIPLKAAIAFGRNVIDALGVTALKLVRLESEERARADAAKVAHHEALAGLQ